jgi:hypothetical protein
MCQENNCSFYVEISNIDDILHKSHRNFSGIPKMQYLLEILKIIDGAMRSDRTKVGAYADQLAKKLEKDGDPQAAKRIRDSLIRAYDTETSLNDFAVSPRLPVDSESRLHLADEVDALPEPPFVAIAPAIRAKVDEFVRYVTEADKLIANGVGISPSLIMFGPPGCGKTLLAKHLASRLHLPILIARSDSLISSYLGSTAKNIRSLFEHAMTRPCVLFLDEFDAFAKGRDDQHELGELKRVVVSLLQNIDALDNRTVLLAASNHEHLLDPAVWRRFAYKLNISMPGPEERKEMIAAFLGRFANGEIEELTSASSGLNGSQICQICEDSIRDAVLSGATEVDRIGLLGRIASTRLSKTIDFQADSPDIVSEVHNLDRHLFNGKTLAAMFKTSPSTITRRLNSE